MMWGSLTDTQATNSKFYGLDVTILFGVKTIKF